MDLDRLNRLQRATGKHVADIAEQVRVAFVKPELNRANLARWQTMTPEQRQMLAQAHTPEEMQGFDAAMRQVKARFEAETQSAQKE